VHTEELLVEVLQIALLELADPVGQSIKTCKEGVNRLVTYREGTLY